MSAADHPTWQRVRNAVFGPFSSAAFLTRAVFPLAVMYFARSSEALFAAVIAPYLLVGGIDIYLRSRFTLRGLLLAIFTLQIPIVILVTFSSILGVAVGLALLVLWLWVVATRIEWAIIRETESSKGGRWKKIEPE